LGSLRTSSASAVRRSRCFRSASASGDDSDAGRRVPALADARSAARQQALRGDRFRPRAVVEFQSGLTSEFSGRRRHSSPPNAVMASAQLRAHRAPLMEGLVPGHGRRFPLRFRLDQIVWLLQLFACQGRSRMWLATLDPDER
jgi:hypothetical protein